METDLVAYCAYCDNQRHLTFVDSYTARDGSEPPVRYSFAHCSSCHRPFVMEQFDYGQGYDAEDAAAVYPPSERELGFQLPKLVLDSYADAVKCESAKAWTATVVMVRRALEAVCKDQLPGTKLVMFEALKELKNQGKLSEENWQWADELRFIGNMGAHPTDIEVTRDDARDSLNFLQAILEIFYHLRPKFEQMRQRRQKP